MQRVTVFWWDVEGVEEEIARSSGHGACQQVAEEADLRRDAGMQHVGRHRSQQVVVDLRAADLMKAPGLSQDDGYQTVFGPSERVQTVNRLGFCEGTVHCLERFKRVPGGCVRKFRRVDGDTPTEAHALGRRGRKHVVKPLAQHFPGGIPACRCVHALERVVEEKPRLALV